ncbi:hypothetical protein [Actinomycetospora sp. NBRC 106378]|nr:hypothetical protein [Actinomycetospora sp. NBRC 106378]
MRSASTSSDRGCRPAALLVAFERATDDPRWGVTRDDRRRAVLG